MVDWKEKVVYNSGAAENIFNNKKWFKFIKLLPRPVEALSSSGGIIRFKEWGVACLTTTLSTGQKAIIEIDNAIYNPSPPLNLISL